MHRLAAHLRARRSTMIASSLLPYTGKIGRPIVQTVFPVRIIALTTINMSEKNLQQQNSPPNGAKSDVNGGSNIVVSGPL